MSEPLRPDGPLRYEHLSEHHFIHRAAMRTLVVDRGSDLDAAVEIDVTEHNTNGAGGLQGGMIATVVDCAAGRAVAAVLVDGARFATLDLSVSYLAPVRVGPAMALARVRKAGRRNVVVQVDVVDRSDDRLCAVATATFAVVE